MGSGEDPGFWLTGCFVVLGGRPAEFRTGLFVTDGD